MARRDSATARKPPRHFIKLPTQGYLLIRFPTQYRGLTSAGKRPQGIKKGQKPNLLRQSARLGRSIEIHETQQKARQQPLPSPVSDVKHLNVSRQRYSVMED